MDVTAARKRRERYFDKGEPFVVPPTTAYGRKHERDRTLMTSAESLVDSSSNSTQHSDAAPVLAQRNTAESSSTAVELDYMQGEENVCDPMNLYPSTGDQDERDKDKSGDEASASWAAKFSTGRNRAYSIGFHPLGREYSSGIHNNKGSGRSNDHGFCYYP